MARIMAGYHIRLIHILKNISGNVFQDIATRMPNPEKQIQKKISRSKICGFQTSFEVSHAQREGVRPVCRFESFWDRCEVYRDVHETCC